MIRVGFIVAGDGTDWIGGTIYIANLLRVIRSLPDSEIEPVVIASPDLPERVISGFPKVEMLRTNLVTNHLLSVKVRKAVQRLAGSDPVMEHFLRHQGIDVLSHSGHLGARASVPTICWIPDFQHRRMPEFFQQRELRLRDAWFRRQCDFCSCLVLSSFDAQKDLADFAPDAVKKSRVLQFVAGFSDGGTSVSLEDLRARYAFNRPYFFLPNQFWAHKNHRIVVNALALLKERGSDAVVLCTGHTKDFRRPEYFDELMQYVDARGVADRFRVLGLVPFGDLSALMRHAIAIINPSRFEGWSTTVEESKSMGKTIILSSIPVHREQAPARGIYFDPDNGEALADTMARVAASFRQDEEDRQQKLAKERLPGRIAAVAENYQSIVRDTLAFQSTPVGNGFPKKS